MNEAPRQGVHFVAQTINSKLQIMLRIATIICFMRHLQMMQRMGWKGSGLGSEEAGITEPVRGGEVRDRRDQGRTGSRVNLSCFQDLYILSLRLLVFLWKILVNHRPLG